MATAKEQLLANMNPQAARLMDQQLRQNQVAQRAQGAGMLSGLVQAYTGMGDIAQRVGGIAPVGATEVEAIQRAQKLKTEEERMESLQAKLSDAPVERLASIYQNNALTNPKLAQAAKAVLDMKRGGTKGGVNENIKAIQLMINNKQVTGKSGMLAIQAERENPGSGMELLVYTSDQAKAEANKSLSAGDKKVYNETLEAQTRLRTQNARSSGLITALKTVDKKSGVPAQVSSVFKRITGSEDSESVLNSMVEALRVEQAIGNLPPGVASDKDIALVMGGTLPSTANPEALIEWLSALQRLNQVTIDEQQAKLEWYDEKGSLQGYATHRKEVNQKRAKEAAKKAEEQARKEAEETNARIEEKKRKLKELLQQQQTQKSNQEAFVESTNIGEFL